jgi:lipoate-protein ligase A
VVGRRLPRGSISFDGSVGKSARALRATSMDGIRLLDQPRVGHDGAKDAPRESNIQINDGFAQGSTVRGYCFALPYEEGDGPANMALDEALLEHFIDQRERAYVRVYGWTTPTLSLGYFQSLAEARADERWRSVALVRRASGGGAIWHEHELTYALALRGGHPLARQRTALYRTVHAAIGAILRERGLNVERRQDREAAPPGDGDRRAGRPFLCFSDHDPEDLVCGGFKVVGSAQRRRAGAILQHGSILLRTSGKTPEHRGICDFMPTSSDPLDWSDQVQEQIAQALELVRVPCDPPADLRRRSREIEGSIYRQSGWTNRR